MTAARNTNFDDPASAGLMVFPSPHSEAETADRMASAVAGLGMTVVARIDHAAAAAQVGLTLRPTLVLIFGNPVAGTPLMQAFPTVAIDLPLKALVWRTDDGRTLLACNDPTWLVERHAATAGPAFGTGGVAELLERMKATLVTAAAQATVADPST